MLIRYGDDTVKQLVKNGSSSNFFLVYLDTHKNKSRSLTHATYKNKF